MSYGKLISVEQISPLHTHYHLANTGETVAALAACMHRKDILKQISESSAPDDIRVITVLRTGRARVITREDALSAIKTGNSGFVLNNLPIGLFINSTERKRVVVLDRDLRIVAGTLYEKDPHSEFLTLCNDIPEEFYSDLLDVLIQRRPSWETADHDSDSIVKGKYITTVGCGKSRTLETWLRYGIYNIDTRKETTISINTVSELR